MRSSEQYEVLTGVGTDCSVFVCVVDATTRRNGKKQLVGLAQCRIEYENVRTKETDDSIINKGNPSIQ